VTDNSIDQQFIEYVVKSLVGKPDAVVVERSVDEKGVLLELTVDPEDLGRVIGKRGATAQSLRTLLRALGTKNDARYNLKIVDNGTGGNHRDDSSSDDTTTAPTKQDDNEGSLTEEPAQEKTVDEEPKPIKEKESDTLSRTRQELAELDDLDI
jgi:predicted RNA-binding protein YlqC (UPF0109 family)